MEHGPRFFRDGNQVEISERNVEQEWIAWNTFNGTWNWNPLSFMTQLPVGMQSQLMILGPIIYPRISAKDAITSSTQTLKVSKVSRAPKGSINSEK